MSSPALNDIPNFAVRFERMMSIHPLEGPCIRDLIFEFYLNFYSEDHEIADRATKNHIEALWNSLGLPRGLVE